MARPKAAPADPPPDPGFDPATMGGYVPDAPTRPAVTASIPPLSQTAPLLSADRSRSALLYKCWPDVFAGHPDYPAQKIGDCVSFGHAHAIDLLQTIMVYLGEWDIDVVGRTCTEALYGAGRECGNMLGNRDGCYGSAMLKAFQTVGALRYNDLPEGQRVYSGDRAKQWGRTGMPSDYRQVAAARRGQGAMLGSAEDMLAALQCGSPCTICTARGFSMTRDSRGVCRMQGRWGHCMGVAGYRGDIQAFCVIQSWGPNSPQGPTDLGQPSWSFWALWDDMEQIIREGDSNTLTGFPGFMPRKMPMSITRLIGA